MVEAAGIEPALESDTFATLFDQIPYTNATPPEACEELIDTFRSLSEQKQITFLQRICEITGVRLKFSGYIATDCKASSYSA